MESRDVHPTTQFSIEKDLWQSTVFESPTSFKDETTTADNKQMTYENFSRNFGHNFCEMIY